MSVLAGTDFFTVEVLTLRGLVTYYVLFFIRLESRRVEVAGITRHPNEAWMKQIARNVTMDEWGFLDGCRYLIHDRDTKYTDSFRAIVKSGHQGKGNVLLFPTAAQAKTRVDGSVGCKERLGGLLKYCHREVA